MKLLLDSHVFIWVHDKPSRLSTAAKEAITDNLNDLFLSTAGAWELQIKIKLGKLSLSESLKNAVSMQRRTNGLRILPVHLSHILQLESLPFHRKDPFDRILISQAIVEGLTVVTADKQFGAYNVNTIW